MLEDSGVLQPEEACGSNSCDAYLAAATDDLCHGVASGIYRARNARRGNAQGKNTLELCLDQC